MILSSAGIIANVLWYEIKNHAQNVELLDFVVMPNHIHGIIVLNGNNGNGASVMSGPVVPSLETGHALSLQSTQLPLHQAIFIRFRGNAFHLFKQPYKIVHIGKTTLVAYGVDVNSGTGGELLDEFDPPFGASVRLCLKRRCI